MYHIIDSNQELDVSKVWPAKQHDPHMLYHPSIGRLSDLFSSLKKQFVALPWMLQRFGTLKPNQSPKRKCSLQKGPNVWLLGVALEARQSST